MLTVLVCSAIVTYGVQGTILAMHEHNHNAQTTHPLQAHHADKSLSLQGSIGVTLRHLPYEVFTHLISKDIRTFQTFRVEIGCDEDCLGVLTLSLIHTMSHGS